MLAGTYNMLAEQGSTLYRVLSLEYPDLVGDPSGETFLPWDLDGYTARMQVRRLIEDTNYMIEITTENSGIDISAGRDHHRYGFSILMAGGGTRPGHIVGAPDELGWHAVADRIHVNDFHATLLHLLGLDHHRLTYRSKGLDVRLTNLGGHVARQVLA